MVKKRKLLEKSLVEAIKKDFENLLKKFQESDSNEFEIFCKLWRESYFTSVFEVETNTDHMADYIDYCFIIIKKFIDHSDKNIQIGALFLLYAIYFKQPIKDWVKIKLNLNEFEKLQNISKINPQTMGIFNKLRASMAFNYGVFSNVLSPIASILDKPYIEFMFSIKQKFENYMDLNDLDELEKLEEEYENALEEYKNKNPNKISSFNTNLAKMFKRKYHEGENDSDDDNVITVETNQSYKIQEIKEKAMKQKNAVYRAERNKTL